MWTCCVGSKCPDFIGHALFSKAVCREDLSKEAGKWFHDRSLPRWTPLWFLQGALSSTSQSRCWWKPLCSHLNWGLFKLSLVFHFSSDYYYFIHSVLKDSWPFVTACPFFLPWGLLFLRNTEYILQKVQVVLPSPSWGLCSYRLQRYGNVRKENIMAKKNKKVTFYIVKRCKQERFIFPPLSVKHSTTNQ